MLTLIGAVLLFAVPLAPAQQRFLSAVVHPYGDEDSDSRAVFATATGVPRNVDVPPDFSELIDAALASSPTFRSQCSRIARAAGLRVIVRRSLTVRSDAAVTRFIRRDGRLDAEVEIGPFGDAILLIAHEFEHILEQLDGVDLASMSGRSGTGVRADPRTGQFETDRAIAIGRQVARETSRAVAHR